MTHMNMSPNVSNAKFRQNSGAGSGLPVPCPSRLLAEQLFYMMGVKTLAWMKSPSTEVGTCACLRHMADHTWWSHMIHDNHDADRSSFQNTSSNHLEFTKKNIHA